jgi:uncharacterized membrane protein (DUF106 family)
MNAIGSIITGFFDVLVLPFGTTHQTLALVWISLLTGVGMAYAFKITSNQKAIKKAKDRLKARILEMRLYQDDPVLIFKGLGGALRGNLVYLSTILVPFVVIVIPVMIVFMQLDGRYAKRYLESDATTILTVQLKEGTDPFVTDVGLDAGDGVIIVGNPVRVAETREVDWRLRVATPGTHQITLTAAGSSYSFPLVAQKSYKMIGHVRQASSFLEPFLHFPLPAIPDQSPFYSIHVEYPSARYPIFGWRVHWIVIFILYSLISAAVLKFALKIEI